MATLKAQNFELEFSYYNLNRCNEIEYSFNITLNGKPFLNPNIISQTTSSVKKDKFIFSDCWGEEDWLHSFFINILTTKKGNFYQTTEPPEWSFKAITWEDQQEEKEKSWESKTIKTKTKNDEIIDVPYAESMKMFIPFWENDIEFKIDFPHEVLDTKEYTTFKLSLKTTFKDLQKFLEEFGNEMKQFYNFFGERIVYLGNGKYQEKEDFKDKFSSLDKDVYLIKRCAEWNKESIKPDNEIVLELLLSEIRMRSCSIVGTARYVLEASISENLAKEIFDLAEEKTQVEKDGEIRKRLEAVKTVISIVFPNALTSSQINDALSNVKKEDIPDEIFDKNEAIYLEYLKTNI